MALLLVAGAVIVPIAGCGGDDAPIEPVTTEATGSDSSEVDAEEFIASADSRCAEANAAIASLSSETSTSTLATAQQREIIRELLGGLRSLGSPPDPSGALDRFYSALEDETSILGREEQAAEGGDPAALASLNSELGRAQEDARDAGEEFGFDECGQQGTSVAGGGDPSTVPAPPSTTPAPTAPVTPTTTAPVAPAPVEPAPVPAPEPAPVPAPPTGGTGAGATGGGTAGGGSGGSSGGSSGGVSPG